MKIILSFFIFILTISDQAISSPLFGKDVWEKKLYIDAQYAHGYLNIYGQNGIPTYTGGTFGGGLEYKFGLEDGFGIFVSYLMGSYENTNNNITQSETIEQKYFYGGLKYYVKNFYFKAGYGVSDGDHESTGTVVQTISFDESSFIVGLGYSYFLMSYVRMNLGIEAYYTSVPPSTLGYSEETRLVNYSAMIGLSFSLPSEADSMDLSY